MEKEYIVAEEYLHGETGDVDDSTILFSSYDEKEAREYAENHVINDHRITQVAIWEMEDGSCRDSWIVKKNFKEKCVETRYKDQLIVKKDDMFHFYLFNEDGDVSEYKASGISDAKRRIDARIKEQGGLFNSDGELCKDSSDNKEYIVAEEFLHGETGDVEDSVILFSTFDEQEAQKFAEQHEIHDRRLTQVAIWEMEDGSCRDSWIVKANFKNN